MLPRRLRDLRRTWSTVRHLRTSQIAYRILRRFHNPRAEGGPPPPLRPLVRDAVEPAARAPFLVGPDTFFLLGQQGRIESARSWNDEAREKLWLYHCHYFEDLVATGWEDRRPWHEALIARWIDENPPGMGNGWEPYPVSLRISNWVLWSRLGGQLAKAWRQSLAMQIRWLRRRIEWHILANHVIANAKALVLAGCWASGPEGDGWLQEGMHLLEGQITEQVLADGGHIERTPMYHCQVLNDLLDVVNGLRSSDLSIPSWLSAAITRMGQWLAIMRHPDGDIPLFNDSAFGMAPSPKALLAYATRLEMGWPMSLPTGSTWLQASGYARLVTDSAVVFCDAAPIAPAWQPGHSHADTLTWEASLHGCRVVVDCGISTYGTSLERCRQRGTAVHNTVMVDEQDSSEVWSGFRVGRRAQVIAAELHGDGLGFTAAHDGYGRLGIGHERTWKLTARSIHLEDHLTGRGSHCLQTGILLHPDFDIFAVESHGIEVVRRNERGINYRIFMESGLDDCEAEYHPAFGIRLPTRRLVSRVQTSLPVRASTSITW